ncbi:outer membrane protein assembly factor BamB [Alishewanella sp. SMS8]|uniref:outer membrane protein assembly factor BamB n=1 Tax=Alishewanella sp. SMS8 TaxID=2994676 RepID=UPI0027411DB8|nr:outer membrane protein assembly factor BamB [Alishewanella sp. SMS8]MDP5206186.1 outer membrane protein assembly factor BamB [Alishewanella sp. SMS9]MDP5459479.1 outer membrane protein assembly factor BamB [Alishewanella sp. SMS8]
MKFALKHAALALISITLIACSSKDKLVLPDIENRISPKKVWSMQVGDGVGHYESGLKPLILDDKVFMASREGIVVAADLATGKRLWTFDLRQDVQVSAWQKLNLSWSEGNARIAGGISQGYGKLFLGTENGEVVALDAVTGSLVWRAQVPGEVLVSPAVGDGFVVVKLGTGTLLALNPDDGEQRWVFENEQPPLTIRGVSEPVIESGGVIYGNANGRIGVLLVDRGFQAWEETVATPKGSTDLSRLVDVDAKPLVVGGTVYTIAFNGELFALDLRSGQQSWKRDYASFRNMAISGSVIYLVDSEGRIYAVDRRNGSEIWSQTGLHNHFLTGPTVYKDYLVIGDNKGHLHWFDRNTGDFVARQSFDDSGFYREAVANNDYIVVTTRDGELVLLQTP